MDVKYGFSLNGFFHPKDSNSMESDMGEAGQFERELRILVDSVDEELKFTNTKVPICCIFRVPERLRDVNKDEDPYSPHIASIGPFHYGQENLEPMEEHKRRYTINLLGRTQDPAKALNDCSRAILSLEKEARECYAGNLGIDRTTLAKVLLIDGCFMIELFLRYSEVNLIETNDPLLATPWMTCTLRRDLILLENQIPFRVLENLFMFTVGRTCQDASPSLTHYAISFFRPEFEFTEEAFRIKCSLRGQHLLDLMHKCCLPSNLKLYPVRGCGARKWEPIHNAMALSEAGIEFVKGTTDNLYYATFDNGVFEIPPLSIKDTTDSLLRNLVALEQCRYDTPHYVTSFVILMDRLIDTPQDVEFLEKIRIIENNLGADEDVSTLFNNICKQVILKEFYFAGLCDQVNAYYGTRWNRYKAALKRDYFNNPWRIISFTAAIILLFLTALQTVLSLLAFVPH